MANEIYREHALKCTSSYNSATDSWVPSISIFWSEGKDFHFHTFDGPDKGFGTAEEALSYGLTLARLWVDKKV